MCGFVSFRKRRPGKTFEIKEFNTGNPLKVKGFRPIHTIMREVQIAPNRARKGQAEGAP